MHTRRVHPSRQMNLEGPEVVTTVVTIGTQQGVEAKRSLVAEGIERLGRRVTAWSEEVVDNDSNPCPIEVY